MINCLSTNCTFNNSGVCNSSVVNIEGFDACVTPETYCKSFIEEDRDSKFSNSSNIFSQDSQSIICSAHNCVFNFSRSCKSLNIQVNHLNSTCETFKSRSYDSKH